MRVSGDLRVEKVFVKKKEVFIGKVAMRLLGLLDPAKLKELLKKFF